ncbi:MAG: DUF1330 domain-containing protein [Pseudomonadota bacterium]
MSLIVIAFLDITDPDEYRTYTEKAGPIFMREGVKLIVNDTDPKPLTEGMEMDKVVIMEFRDQAHMQGFFGLSDYREAQVHRDKGATMRTVMTQRFQMPS